MKPAEKIPVRGPRQPLGPMTPEERARLNREFSEGIERSKAKWLREHPNGELPKVH